jgi:hypothetical protein
MTILTENGISYILRDNARRVPLRIFPRQLWLALIKRGIYEPQVMAIIDSLPEAQRYTAIAELKGHVYERTSPWIDQIGGELKLSADDIDDVFIAGEGL